MNERNDSSLLLLFLAVQREVDVKNTHDVTRYITHMNSVNVRETGEIEEERKRGKYVCSIHRQIFSFNLFGTETFENTSQ